MKQLFPCRLLAAFMALCLGGAPSCTCCSGLGKQQETGASPSAAGYARVCGMPGQMSWPLYVTGDSGPPVLLLHDVLGPRPQCLETGRRISKMGNHYKVYVPVFFGRLGEASSRTGVDARRGGWSVLGGGGTDPEVFSDVKNLCALLRVRHGGRQVVVIGNCLTGGLAIALLASPDVSGVITSQPSRPFFSGGGLDVSPLTLAAARTRAAQLRQPAILAFRYHRDLVCRQPRLKRIAREFGSAFDGIELCEPGELSSGGRTISTSDSRQHTVLIPEENPDLLPKNQASHEAVLKMVSRFLRGHAD